jgi:hypothetical protein
MQTDSRVPQPACEDRNEGCSRWAKEGEVRLPARHLTRGRGTDCCELAFASNPLAVLGPHLTPLLLAVHRQRRLHAGGVPLLMWRVLPRGRRAV